MPCSRSAHLHGVSAPSLGCWKDASNLGSSRVPLPHLLCARLRRQPSMNWVRTVRSTDQQTRLQSTFSASRASSSPSSSCKRCTERQETLTILPSCNRSQSRVLPGWHTCPTSRAVGGGSLGPVRGQQGASSSPSKSARFLSD
ncbi:unnamed protein product, partial [Ixodes pacificus]